MGHAYEMVGLHDTMELYMQMVITFCVLSLRKYTSPRFNRPGW